MSTAILLKFLVIRVNIDFLFIYFILFINFTILVKGFQKWIGYVDVKSAPVHFYVQRNTKFNTTGTPIPFELVRVNEGNAMNLQTGKFTAPRPGIYFFSFTGLAEFPVSSSRVRLGVYLHLNGVKIGAGYVSEANTVVNQVSPFPLQSTLNLKKGDQVWLQIFDQSTGASLFDNGEQFTHFTGFLLQEEIVSSL